MADTTVDGGATAEAPTSVREAMAQIDASEPDVTQDVAGEVEVEASPPVSDSVPDVAPDDSGPADEIANLEAFFAEEEKSEPKDDDDLDFDDDEDTGAEAQPSRANRRIRSLSRKLKEEAQGRAALEHRLAEQQQWSQQAYQNFQQQNEQIQAMRIEMAKAQARMEAGLPREPAVDDPVAKFRTELRDEFRTETTQAMDPLSKEVRELKQQLAQEKAAVARRQKIDTYSRAVDSALERELAPHLVGDDFSKYQQKLGGLTIALATAQGNTDFDSAASDLRKTVFELARSVIRAKSKTTGAKVQESNQVPQVSPQGRPGAKGETLPDWGLLRKNNYNSYLQWQMAGEPPLR